MKKYWVRALLLLSLASSVSLAETNWIGFKKLSDSAVPAPVRAAADSVYRIMFPSGPFTIVDLGTPELVEAAIAKFEKQNWEMVQLVYCRLQSIRKCPVSAQATMGGGSAFLVRDQHTVATNLHNVYPWLQAVFANNSIGDQKLEDIFKQMMVPNVLLNNKGEIRFTPFAAARDNAFGFQLVNPDASLFEPHLNMQSVRFAMSDYVELRFTQPFPEKPLELSNDVGEGPLYPVGFPGPTGVFAAAGGVDGDGKSQLVSMGIPLEINELSLFTSALAGDFLKRISAAAYIGNSGGPVLRADGKVAGILRSGMVENANSFFADFIRLNDLGALQAQWNRGTK